MWGSPMWDRAGTGPGDCSIRLVNGLTPSPSAEELALNQLLLIAARLMEAALRCHLGCLLLKSTPFPTFWGKKKEF